MENIQNFLIEFMIIFVEYAENILMENVGMQVIVIYIKLDNRRYRGNYYSNI